MGVVKLADYRPQLEVVEHRVADTEDGFMRVANEITDSLLMADLTVRQLTCRAPPPRHSTSRGFMPGATWCGCAQSMPQKFHPDGAIQKRKR